ncbi:MAG: hypothetical protein ACLSVD_17650 [Eggerthellaceae bacterium]
MFPDFESEAARAQDHPRAHRAHGPGLADGGRLHEPELAEEGKDSYASARALRPVAGLEGRGRWR